MKKILSWTLVSIILLGTPMGTYADTAAQPQASQAREVNQLLTGIEEKVTAIETAAEKGGLNYHHQSELAQAVRLLDLIEQEAYDTLRRDDSLIARITALRDRITKLQEQIKTLRREEAEDSLETMCYFGRKKGAGRLSPAYRFAAPAGCTPAPCPAPMFPQQEPWNREGYAHLDENPFVSVVDDPLSTFSIDVDTASYSNLRRMLNAGQQQIPRGAVRIEEMINYFRYRYRQPGDQHPLAMDVETTACPWAPHHRLARVALQAKTIDISERKPSNLVFLIDSSGSMSSPNKLDLLKKAYALLIDNLDEHDKVAIVAYAGSAGLVLPSTTANNRLTLKFAVENLRAGGSTAGGAGIKLAYKTAREHFIKDGNNRVILATDGDFNVGVSSESELVDLITEEARSGVFLTVLGFGTGNYQDSRMEALSNKGNGNYAYIDTMAEARKVFLSDLTGTLYTVAKDVKFQLEFNPAYVDSYRLIGYENRQLADRDFTDDKKDAGEVGSGHQVTALYELVPAGVGTNDAVTANLRYQTGRDTVEKAELMQIKVRYKAPQGTTSTEFAGVVPLPADWQAGMDFAGASADTRFAAAVGAFGMLLRGSQHKGVADLDWVYKTASAALDTDPGGYRSAFCELVRKARALNATPEPDPKPTPDEPTQ
jgi:Ca-activated chloride channel family protein